MLDKMRGQDNVKEELGLKRTAHMDELCLCVSWLVNWS